MILISTIDIRETVDSLLYTNSKYARYDKKAAKDVVFDAINLLINEDKCVEATPEQHLKLLDGKLKDVNDALD